MIRPLPRTWCWPLLWLGLVGLFGPSAPGDDKPSREALELARFDARIKPADRAHWAFQPVRKQVVPRVQDTSWVRNPIDAFVLAKLEKQGWKPSPPAEPR